MTTLRAFDPSAETVGMSRDLVASVMPAAADPGIPVNGLTIGIASMSESAPHGGEMHPDGDEVLYLISGKARVVLESEPVEETIMYPGDGLVVPQGVWHRVEILEPAQIVYATPGPNNQVRPL
ncbi:MAG: cupin domain-containing protein [Xanthomonadales bacterium]|nr:cupin domain-containing protein [Xanthomonadales bacterium]